jgi:hypothetical protein
MIYLTILAWAVFLLVAYYFIKQLMRWNRSRYDERHPDYWKRQLHEQTFETRTLANFRVLYKLVLEFERVDDNEFNTSRMLSQSSEGLLGLQYKNDVFLPFLEENSCGFRLGWNEVVAKGRLHHALYSSPTKVFQRNEEIYCRDLHHHEISGPLGKRPFTSNGCAVQFREFIESIFPDDLIEENYAMLNGEQKEEIERDERYRAFDEMLTVAALKRRLDFLADQKKQSHETGMISIETEAAGRGLKIKWLFKENAPSGYDLLGLRKPDGFFQDQWDIESNGTLVIQSSKNGETTEFLDEGTTYFYTFILRPWKEDQKSKRYAIARFQVTMESSKETDAVRKTLERLEQRKPVVDPARENMSQALKELGLVMEFDEAIDEMEKSLIERIRAKNLPKEEEEEKVEFVRDAARLQRDKYQP